MKNILGPVREFLVKSFYRMENMKWLIAALRTAARTGKDAVTLGLAALLLLAAGGIVPPAVLDGLRPVMGVLFAS